MTHSLHGRKGKITTERLQEKKSIKTLAAIKQNKTQRLQENMCLSFSDKEGMSACKKNREDMIFVLSYNWVFGLAFAAAQKRPENPPDPSKSLDSRGIL